jgi:hypothetical protein
MSLNLGERALSRLPSHTLFVKQRLRKSQDVDKLDHEASSWVVLSGITSLPSSGGFINALATPECPNSCPKVSGDRSKFGMGRE